jgi:hypothetical protein
MTKPDLGKIQTGKRGRPASVKTRIAAVVGQDVLDALAANGLVIVDAEKAREFCLLFGQPAPPQVEKPELTTPPSGGE